MATTPDDLLNAAFMIDARKRMVDSQIRPNKVSNPGILEAMRRLPRERFLPASLVAQAYSDQDVPLGGGRVLLQPMVLARLVQALAPLNGEKTLVVGAGTGYSAALLAALGCDVTAQEEPGPLLDQARIALTALAPTVALVSSPLASGWSAGAPYDLILVDGAVSGVPTDLGNQLNRESGRLAAIVEDGGHTGHAILAEATPAGLSVRALFDCRCPVLPGFARTPAFEF